MTQIDYKIENQKLLDNILKFREGKEIKKTLNKSIKKSMYVVLWDVLRKVPVDTWNLKRNHQVFFWNLYGEIFTDVEYAEKVHEGIWQKRQPWLLTSMQTNKERIAKIFSDKIDHLIKKI